MPADTSTQQNYAGPFVVEKSLNGAFNTSYASMTGRDGSFLTVTARSTTLSPEIAIGLDFEYFEGKKSGKFGIPDSKNHAGYVQHTDHGSTSFDAKRGTFEANYSRLKNISGRYQFFIEHQGKEVECAGTFNINVEL